MEKNIKDSEGLFRGLLKVAFSIDILTNLSQVQLEILSYLVVDERTPIQIKKKRKTSIQAVRKIISKLRAKGLINKFNRPNIDVVEMATPYSKDEGGYSTSHPHDSLKKYRLHGQNMTIKILKTSKQYWKILTKLTQKTIKHNTIQLYRNKLVVYSNTFFYSDDVDDCFRKSDAYWTQFFRIIENELGITIINGKYTSIYQFRCHIGKVGDSLAQQVIKKKLKYEVVDDLGRVRLIIDNSKRLFEKEAVDNRLCQDDMRRIGDFELDMIEMKEDLTLSDVANFMKHSTPILNKTNVIDNRIEEISKFFPALEEYNENIVLHLEVQREQLKTQKLLQNLIEKKLK